MTQTRMNRARTPIDSYLSELDSTPLLTAEEERALARRILTGDCEARDHLIRANLRLVVHLARRFSNRGLLLEDLIAEGNVGLLRATEGFDPDMGTRFATYATYWVRQSMRRAVHRDGNAVRLPQYMWTLVGKWQLAAAALEREFGYPATEEEIVAYLGLPPKKVRAVRKALRALASAQVADDTTGLDPVTAAADGREPGPGEALAGAEELQAAVSALEGLAEREASILRLRFGLDGGAPATLKEVGDRLGYTRERVRQIERDALLKLRNRIVA